MSSAGRLPKLATVVHRTMLGAHMSREAWEERGDGRPIGDVELSVENLLELLHRHGLILAHLCLHGRTRDELSRNLHGATRRLPVLLEGTVYGRQISPLEFIRSVAGLLALHREAIERVTAEQVVRTDVIEEVLAEAPVPVADEGSTVEMLAAPVTDVVGAHSEALVIMAMELDERLEKFLQGD